MEVGIEDCLHIEFEYQRSKFHLTDVIVGRIYFLLVRIKIKFMELAIVRKESTVSSSMTIPFNQSFTLGTYELMDGNIPPPIPSASALITPDIAKTPLH